MATKNSNQQGPTQGKGNANQVQGKTGNAGNTGNRKGFDEQHGARGSQLNANTTGNTGKSKHRGE